MRVRYNLTRGFREATRLFDDCFGPFGRSVNGTTAIEYGLIVALIAVAIISAISTIDPGFDGLSANLATGLKR